MVEIKVKGVENFAIICFLRTHKETSLDYCVRQETQRSKTQFPPMTILLVLEKSNAIEYCCHNNTKLSNFY